LLQPPKVTLIFVTFLVYILFLCTSYPLQVSKQLRVHNVTNGTCDLFSFISDPSALKLIKFD